MFFQLVFNPGEAIGAVGVAVASLSAEYVEVLVERHVVVGGRWGREASCVGLFGDVDADVGAFDVVLVEPRHDDGVVETAKDFVLSDGTFEYELYFFDFEVAVVVQDVVGDFGHLGLCKVSFDIDEFGHASEGVYDEGFCFDGADVSFNFP